MSGSFRVLWIGSGSPLPERAVDPVGYEGPSVSVTTAPPNEDPDAADLTDVDCVVVGGAVDDPVARTRSLSPTVPVAVVLDGADVSAADALAAGAAEILRPADLTGGAAVAANRLATVVAAETRAAHAPTAEDAPIGDPFAAPYRTLVESVGDPMYVLDDSGYCTMANEALATYAGYEREEVIGMHASEIVGEDDFDRASELINSLAADDGDDWGRIEVTFESSDGETRIGEATIVVLSEGDAVTGSAGVIRDVSEREARARELTQYETIVETAPIGLFVVDDDGTIDWANDEFFDGFAEPPAEIVGEPFTALVERGYFEPEIVTNYVEYVRRLLSSDAEDEVVVDEVRFRAADGETRIYDTYNALLPLEDGDFRGTVHAFREVTEQRRYQRELERQNDRLDRFASLVSHDLRNPLNVAQGHVEVLEAAVDHDSVAEVAWALDRMAELIEDVLALARQGRTVGDTEPVELGAVAAAAWDVVETGSATLERDVDGPIRADDGRLRELFTNLFRNAIEHGGDDVTVRVGRLDDGNGHSDGTDDGEGLDVGDAGFYVEDDGPGLPADGDVFEVGYTTAQDGTGFGLAIVSEIADAHGWSVTAGESERGGARFEITGVTSTTAED